MRPVRSRVTRVVQVPFGVQLAFWWNFRPETASLSRAYDPQLRQDKICTPEFTVILSSSQKPSPSGPPRSTISTRASYSRFPINKMSRRTRLAAHGSISSTSLYPISKSILHRRTPSVRGGRKHRQFFPYLHCSSIERGQQGGGGLNGRGGCDADPDERSRCVGDAGAMDNGLVPREGPLDGLWWASARSSEQRGGCVGVREARICHSSQYNRRARRKPSARFRIQRSRTRGMNMRIGPA